MPLPPAAIPAALSIIKARAESRPPVVDDGQQNVLQHLADADPQAAANAYVEGARAHERGKSKRAMVVAGAVLGVAGVAAATTIYFVDQARDFVEDTLDKIIGSTPKPTAEVQAEALLNNIELANELPLVKGHGISSATIKTKTHAGPFSLNPLGFNSRTAVSFESDLVLQLGEASKIKLLAVRNPQVKDKKQGWSLQAHYNVDDLGVVRQNEVLRGDGVDTSVGKGSQFGEFLGDGKKRDDKIIAAENLAKAVFTRGCGDILYPLANQGVEKRALEVVTSVRNLFNSIPDPTNSDKTYADTVKKQFPDAVTILDQLINNPIAVVPYKEVPRERTEGGLADEIIMDPVPVPVEALREYNDALPIPSENDVAGMLGMASRDVDARSGLQGVNEKGETLVGQCSATPDAVADITSITTGGLDRKYLAYQVDDKGNLVQGVRP